MHEFECVKDMYANNADFASIYMSSDQDAIDKFYKHDWYFLGKMNYVCLIILYELLVPEAHNGRLMEHFNVMKPRKYHMSIL